MNTIDATRDTMNSAGANTPLNAMLEQTKVGPARRTLGQPTLEDANHRSNTNVYFVGYLLDRKSCCSQAHYFIAIEDPMAGQWHSQSSCRVSWRPSCQR